MAEVKEITVFSVGDSTNLKTWSNVPYFFTKTLELKGYKVNRVNIEENETLFNLYKYTAFAFLKLIYRNSNHTYFRSKLNYILTNKKISNALETYSNTGAAIFLTFSFTVPENFKKKVISFGDWTYLYYISTFLDRKQKWFERSCLEREKQHIEKADLVLGLFPLSTTFIRKNYSNTNVHYLGNVINSNFELNKEKILETKQNSQKLLFIGNEKYLQGAMELIETFKKIKSIYPDLELHFIGINKEDTKLEYPSIFYHGYLNKSVTSENERYYKLLSEALVITNSTKDWGGFSSTTEAMYFYTPVITRPYDEFTETYGSAIDFGYFIDENNTLITCIEKMLKNSKEEQIQLMMAAHKSAKDFTWSNYIDKLMGLI
ncbi:MAG: glycosyltransferase [Bacteroidota bacterium]|nr:glycosyltransferase [Bacteroidota bacterium]